MCYLFLAVTATIHYSEKHESSMKQTDWLMVLSNSIKDISHGKPASIMVKIRNEANPNTNWKPFAFHIG